VTYYRTVMARYSLFVLKVPLNPKQTNKPKSVPGIVAGQLICSLSGGVGLLQVSVRREVQDGSVEPSFLQALSAQEVLRDRHA